MMADWYIVSSVRMRSKLFLPFGRYIFKPWERLRAFPCCPLGKSFSFEIATLRIVDPQYRSCRVSLGNDTPGWGGGCNSDEWPFYLRREESQSWIIPHSFTLFCSKVPQRSPVASGYENPTKKCRSARSRILRPNSRQKQPLARRDYTLHRRV